MKLKSISYVENKGTESEWSIEDLKLNDVNLLCGGNGSGKTRVLEAIKTLAWLIRLQEYKAPLILVGYDACFKNGKDDYQYKLRIENNNILYESLLKNGRCLLNREIEETGGILYFENGEKRNLTLEKNETAVKCAYEEADGIYEWAHSSFLYDFSKPAEYEMCGDYFIPKDPKDIFSVEVTSETIRDLEKIGFYIDEIIKPKIIFQYGHITGIDIREKGNIIKTWEIPASLYKLTLLFLHINYCIINKIPLFLMLDNAGDGLDREISGNFINLLIEKCAENDIQLIIASNNKFIIDKIPLENISLIIKETASCKIKNKHNYKALFEDFRFTGLSNYNLFDY